METYEEPIRSLLGAYEESRKTFQAKIKQILNKNRGDLRGSYKEPIRSL